MEQVKNTRQELLRLRKNLVQVKRAKVLLDQKMNTLVQEFLRLKGRFLEKKKNVFEKTKEIIKIVEFSVKFNPVSLLDFIGASSSGNIEISKEEFSTMGVKSKIFKLKSLKKPEIDKTICPTTFLKAITKFEEILPELIELSSLESVLNKLAKAIEKTRRRVNYLKDLIIPDLEHKIKYLRQRLSDQERESFVFNLKFKKKKLLQV